MGEEDRKAGKRKRLIKWKQFFVNREEKRGGKEERDWKNEGQNISCTGTNSL